VGGGRKGPSFCFAPDEMMISGSGPVCAQSLKGAGLPFQSISAIGASCKESWSRGASFHSRNGSECTARSDK
jgi:hypothetical protein